MGLAFGVIPLSIWALTMGCRSHRRLSVWLPGGLGIILIGLAAMSPWLGLHSTERMVTIVGSLLIVIAHAANFRLCRTHKLCHH